MLLHYIYDRRTQTAKQCTRTKITNEKFLAAKVKWMTHQSQTTKGGSQKKDETNTTQQKP